MASPRAHAAAPPSREDPLTGRELGGCRLERLLATGGMGRVYLARHLTLQKPVAVKVLRSDLPLDVRAVDRFLLEARATSALEHLHIVPVYDAGREEGIHYLVMQYVPGESLAGRLRRERLPREEALRIFRDVAEAVAFAHARGVIHRDIKPDNILLGERGEVKLTDFGLARMLQGDASLSRTGDVIGSPNFMAPEQALGKKADQRTDVYGLGATLYQLTTGEPPFKAPNPISVIMKVIHQPLRPPHTLPARVERPLSDLIVGMMQKRRSARPASVAEVLERLDRIEKGRGKARAPRRRLAWLAAALLLTASCAAAAALAGGRGRWRTWLPALPPGLLEGRARPARTQEPDPAVAEEKERPPPAGGLPSALAGEEPAPVAGSPAEDLPGRPAALEPVPGSPPPPGREPALLPPDPDRPRPPGPGLSPHERMALRRRCCALRDAVAARDLAALTGLLDPALRGRLEGRRRPWGAMERHLPLLGAADLETARIVTLRGAPGERRVLVVLRGGGLESDQVLSLTWVFQEGEWYWRPRWLPPGSRP